MPTFYLKTYVDDKFAYNDDENFYWEIVQVNSTTGEEGVIINTISCLELINSWTHLSYSDRQALIRELTEPEYMLCPDVDYMQVQNSAYEEDSSYFYLEISKTDSSTKDIVDGTVLTQSAISRYFNPEEYENSGYESPITLHHDTRSLQWSFKSELSCQISKNDVELYD